MPVYNGEAFLNESISSVIQQSYADWELIIVDDGSTDNTNKIINDFAALDNRISTIYQANKKQGLARNEGIKQAKGKIIAFLDADDLWKANKLEFMVDFFHQSACELVFSDAYIQDDATAENKRFGVTNTNYSGAKGLESFLFYNRIPLLTVLVKREAIFEVGLFNNRGISEDYELWLKLLLRGFEFKSTSEALATYRVHAQSTTYQDKLAIDANIDVIYGLYKNVDPIYQKLFGDYLKVWYRRKFETIKDRAAYLNFLNVVTLQNQDSAKYQLLQKINLALLGYQFHKRLLSYLIR